MVNDLRVDSLNFQIESLCIRIEWLLKKKSFLKSRKIVPTISLSIYLIHWSINFINAV